MNQIPPELQRQTLLGNIAGNLVAAGQGRAPTSPANAMANLQDRILARKSQTLQNTLEQRQEDRLQAAQNAEQTAAAVQQERIQQVKLIAFSDLPLSQKIPLLETMGEEGAKVAEQMRKRLMATKKFDVTTPQGPLTRTMGFDDSGAYGVLGEGKKSPLVENNIGTVADVDLSKANTKIVEDMIKRKTDVEGIENSLRGLRESQEVLASGDIISGFGADWRLGFAKAMNLVGANNEETIARTETFLNSMGRQTAEVIKAFGSGTGLSDADREYAAGIAGGNIKISPKAIKRLGSMVERVYRHQIEKYNKDANKIQERTQGKLFYDFTIDPLPEYETPEANTPEDKGPLGVDASSGWKFEIIEE